MIFTRCFSSSPCLNKRPKPNTPISLSPTIETLLKTCKSLRALQQIHSQIIQKGHEEDNFLINLFICLCNSFSNIGYATSVFDRVSQPNLYLWNSILKGYCEKSSVTNTLTVFNRLKHSQSVIPDSYTFPSLIKVCSNELAIRQGRAIHGSAVRYGVDMDAYVSSSLIDLYGKCKEIQCARKVFDVMVVRNEVSWTSMIVGCLNFGDLREAQRLFDEMPCRNANTWNAMISGCAKLGDLKIARRLFDEMPEKNVVSYTSLIDGYAKAGDMAMARFFFDQAPKKDIVAWTALITGYVKNGQANEAVKIFMEMQSKNVRPDDFIIVSLMSACSQVGNFQLAKWVDSYVIGNSFDLRCVHVGAALVDMNAKCGNMERATSLFEEMPKRDLVSYCSMIQGLLIHGRAAQSVQLFARMLAEGLIPDNVAFTVVFTACSHAGLVEEGWKYFTSMKNDYSIVPTPDHYACMVDLLGRAGHLETAYELIKYMPVEPHAGAWGGLLGACRLHGNVELGEIIAGHLFQLEPLNAGNYVLLSNIYADANRWVDVSVVRENMRERGLRKIPGHSWV